MGVSNYIRVFLYLLCGLSSLWLYGQQPYKEKKYGYTDGLPSENVLNTFNNSSGFLFVHTQRGISVFDGYRFLPHPELTGQIYSYFQKGDTLYYENTQALYSILIDRLDRLPVLLKNKEYTDSDPNNDHFQGLFIDSQNRIWCHDFENIKYILPDGTIKNFQLFPGNKALASDIHFLEYTPEKLLLLTPTGIYQWESHQKDTLVPLPHIKDLLIEKAIPLSNHQLLFSTQNHRLIFWNSRLNKIEKTIPAKTLTTIKGFCKTEHGLLLYTTHEVWVLNTATSVLRKVFHSSEVLNQVYQDKHTGMLWLSTQNGLTKLSKIKEGIQAIYSTLPTNTPNPTLAIVHWNEQIVFLNTLGEIWSYSNEKRKLLYKHPIAKDLTSLSVIKNQLYVTSQTQVYKYSEAGLFPLPLKNLSRSNAPKKIILTPQNELWILYAKEKIKVYNTDTFEEITFRFKNPENFWEDNLWNDLIVNHDGKIWLSGWMPKSFGINYYDASLNRFVDISDQKINPDRKSFVGDYYNSSAQALQHNELLFTAYGGWNRLNSDGKVIQKVAPEQYYFEDHYLVGISEDRQGNVFVGTGEGLLVYLKEKDQNIHISKADGLPSDKLVYASTSLHDSLFLLGTDNGLVVINKEKILRSEMKNKMVLSKIMVNGKARFATLPQIELNKDENNLALFFSNLSFLDPNKVIYRYRFDQDDWMELGHNPELMLSHLAPGSYTLEVACTDYLGNSQPQTLVLSIVVHPPFTQSYLFYSLILLSGTGVTWGVYRFLLQKQRKEEKYKRDIKDREMQTLRAQMNPHFMFNTLNALNSFIIQNDTKNASRYLTSFSKLMRNILENSKLSVVLLKKEVETLRLYMELESARLDNFFDYQIVIDPMINPETTLIPPTILQPFVENAIWHGVMHRTNGFIHVHIIQQDRETLRIEIEDNGVGRTYSRQLKKNQQTSHKSFGIPLTQERLQLINPANHIELIDLIDTNGKGIGTRVVITIKTLLSHESDSY
jgi:two-component sensor histidine kinase